jgi:hypothetical protein
MESHNDQINPDARRDPRVFFPAYKEVHTDPSFRYLMKIPYTVEKYK